MTDFTETWINFIHERGFLCLVFLDSVLSSITCSEDEGEESPTWKLLKVLMHSSFCHLPSGKYFVPSFPSLSVVWWIFAHLCWSSRVCFTIFISLLQLSLFICTFSHRSFSSSSDSSSLCKSLFSSEPVICLPWLSLEHSCLLAIF